MASHETAINTLLDGLKNRQLENVLASNCVVDWFGRTLKGQNNVINFYQNSNAFYEHSLTSVESCEPFEERPYHFLTREQPPENLKTSPDLAGGEQWFDCETHSPVNLKDGNDGSRTPLQKPTPARCPPAPCRHGAAQHYHAESDSDDLEIQDDEESNLSGIRPLDGTTEAVSLRKDERSPNHKRFKKNDDIVVEPCLPAESRFSDLFYAEATGVVTINRQPASSGESEKRDCKLLLSYRINNEEPINYQIALIVYKSNSNTRTRRNLISAFDQKATEVISPTTTNIPSSSRSRSSAKDCKKPDGKPTAENSSDDAGSKYSKATKRPMMSKTSLRF